MDDRTHERCARCRKRIPADEYMMNNGLCAKCLREVGVAS